MLVATLGGAVVALVGALAWFNLKRQVVVKAAARASTEQLERIYQAVERVGNEISTAGVLARTNQKVEQRDCLIPLPADVPDFPWAGRCVRIDVSPEVQFHFVEPTVGKISLLGNVYRYVRVPSVRLGRAAAPPRNWYTPARYVARSAPLRAVLVEVCPRYPRQLLEYLLCVGRESFEFEKVDQARVGGVPAWVQRPGAPGCGTCGKPMRLILQIPGPLLGSAAFRSATFYFLGCGLHPEKTRSLRQFD